MKHILITSILILFAFSVFTAEKDSLQNLLSTVKGDQKAELMIELAEEISNEKFNDAMILLKGADELAVESGNIKLEAKIHLTAGDILFNSSKYYDSSIEYKASLKIYEELLDKPMIIKLSRKVGKSSYQLSSFDNALIFYFKALKYADNISDKLGKAEVLNDIGLVFEITKDYDKALEYLNESLDIYRSLLNMPKVANVLNNIAIVYSAQGNRNEALKVFTKVLTIYENEKLELYQAIIMNNMSDIYIEEGNVKDALRYLGKAEIIFKKLKDNYGLGLIDHNYGKAYLKSKKYNSARKYLLKSKKAFENMGVQVMVRNNLIHLVKLDSITSNYKRAFLNLNEYNKINDEILSAEKEQKIAELNLKYKNEKSEKQLYSQIRDKKLAQSNFEKQKSINNFFLIIFVLTVITIYFVYRSYKLKSVKQELLKKYSLEIEVLNKKLIDEIDITTKQLNESNRNLMNSEKDAARLDKMVSLGTLLAGITHEIKNPGQVIKLSLDNMRLSLNDLAVFIYALINVKSSDKKLALETKKLLKKHEVTKIFNNLKNLVVSNKKSIEMIDQIVNSTSKMSFYSREFSLNSINEIIKDVLVLVNNNIKYNAKVELELHAKLPKYKCNFQEIAQILFNLLSNAKDAISQKGLHSDQGIIKIGTKFENKNIILEVEDNGCGMDESQLNKAFNSFYTTKEMGKGLGLGLSIVKSIVDNYSGRISIQSKLNEGTKFRISFPTKKDISIERDNDTLNSVVFLGKSDDKTEVETEEQASTISEELSDDDVFNNSNIDLEQYTSDDEELSDDDLFNDDDIYLNDNNEARDA